MISRRTLFRACRATLVAGVASGVLVTHGQAQHSPHEHGVGQLNIAIEGNVLEMELIAPGADIVGFEHPPHSDEDKHAVEHGVEKLKAATALFKLPDAAGCALEEAEIESGLIEAMSEGHDHNHAEDHKKKDDHGHGDGHVHGHEHKHEHGEKSHSDHADGEHHAEFHAHYHFECTDISALTEIEVGYFGSFPAAQELDVQYLSPKGQGAAELTAGAPKLSLP
jgi:hypothetical protein